MKFITRRREVEAVQIPDIVGQTPESYLAALKSVVEFLDRHSVTYTLTVDGDFDGIEITDKTGEWTPVRCDWLVADPTSENDPVTLYTSEEFRERFVDVTSHEEFAETKARTAQIITTALQTNFGLNGDSVASELADVLDEEGCLAYDDARDLGDLVVGMRDELVRNIITVWQAMTRINGEGADAAPRAGFATTAVGALIDTIHGREWNYPPVPIVIVDEASDVPDTLDPFAHLDTAVTIYHETHGRPDLGAMLGWFLVRDYETAIAIVTSAELPRKQLSGMIHEAARVVDRGDFS